MDRLSQLPDDLLIKILSFVPTKDDVAMSILSKRWLSLWTSVPRVIFYDFSEEDSHEDEEGNEIHAIRSLSQFVFGTLLLHKAAVLERFHLNTTSECSLSQIGLWVRIAVDRFVHNLKISFFITITVLFCFRVGSLDAKWSRLWSSIGWFFLMFLLLSLASAPSWSCAFYPSFT